MSQRALVNHYFGSENCACLHWAQTVTVRSQDLRYKLKVHATISVGLAIHHTNNRQLYRPHAMGRHLQQHRATTAFGTSSTTTSGNHTNHSPRKAIDNHGTKMGRRLYVWFDHVTILNETTILLISHYVFSSTTIISLHMGLISNYSPNVFM